MSKELMIGLIVALVVIVIIIVVILIKNNQKASIKHEIEELNIRFNAVKTVPLAFKLSKAQAMAKRNDETADEVRIYYEKFEDAQKHIDQISDLLANIEDSVAMRNYRQAKEALTIVRENIEDSENEVNDIDKFLEQFSKEENDQRDHSVALKERFRELKLMINSNVNNLSIAYDGLNEQIGKCENMFSLSEEYMYANEYLKSQETLADIAKLIDELEDTYKAIPDLVKDVKGVIPNLLDEANRSYALSRQRGLYLDHLQLTDRLNEIENDVGSCTRTLSSGNITGLKDEVMSLKASLNEVLDSLNAENSAFGDVKKTIDEVADDLNELKRLHFYVSEAYKKDKERFGIEDLETYLNEQNNKNEDYKAQYIAVSQDSVDNSVAATELLGKAKEILANTANDKEQLLAYKNKFDKNANDEQRAKNQLMKLQIVLNEVEVKVLEYRLPTIADSYHEDLVLGRKKVAEIKRLLDEVPLDIDKLNSTLDEAIDFIYKFYNNVNNIVGMAIMVENAIVFGNKYRSSYSEVDRDLSKAEFSYLNGEYTKALTMAISCMEKLFPDAKNDNYLENV